MKRVFPFVILAIAVLGSSAIAASIDYSTYFGGSDEDFINDIALGPDGSIYIAGATTSPDLPILNAYDSTFNGAYDVFVARFSPQGELLGSTYLGGSADESDGNQSIPDIKIAVDGAGYIFVTGVTESSDFPVVNAFDSTYDGQGDAFLAKLSPGCDSLIFSTFLGGGNKEWYSQVGLDDLGNAYFGGYTDSPDFPLVNPEDSTAIAGEMWLAEIPAGSATPEWITFLGGNGYDWLWAMAVDGNGNIYVTGQSSSRDLPYIFPCEDRYRMSIVAKVSPSGHLEAINYFGSYSGDCPFSIAIDAAGNVYVGGRVDFSSMPVVNPYDGLLNHGDAFLWKISNGLDSLLYSTYLGGYEFDYIADISTDNLGNAYVVGSTNSSPDFPVINPVDNLKQDFEAFVAILPTTGGCPLISSYLGGSYYEMGYAAELGEDGKLYAAGLTNSPDLPGPYAYDATYNGGVDGFLTKIDLFGLETITGSIAGTVRNHISEPLEGARAVLEGCVAEAYTDAAGAYALTDVCPGYYQIEFSHPDYSDTTITAIALDQGEVITLPDIFLSSKGTVMGTVTDLDGAPIAGAEVVAVNNFPIKYDTTDEQGRYLLRGFDSIIANVTFSAPFYYDTIISDIQITVGETTIVDGVMTPFRQEVSAWFGNVDGSPVEAPIGGIVGIDLWIQTADTVDIVYLDAPLAAMDSYVTAFYGETEGQLYYPLNQWYVTEFNPPVGSPPNISGWSSQAFMALCNMSNPPDPRLHSTTPIKVATYVVRVVDDPGLVGDTVFCLGQGPQPHGYPGIVAGAPGGVSVWSTYEYFSPLVFTTGEALYVPGDINGLGGANGVDVIYAVSYFKGGAPPPVELLCPPHGPLYAAGDVNGNCVFNGIDITYFVAYLKGGPALSYCPDCPPMGR